MEQVLSTLLARYSDTGFREAPVIPWSSPVPVFGRIASSYVATLGLNPSNREFVDEHGKELDGSQRRFETLGSLGLRNWKDVTSRELEKITYAFESYFSNNPYNTWFKRLDLLISDTRASYYCGTASHLDLIPYATSCKWSTLSSTQRARLLKGSGGTLALLLRDSPVRVLILNGASVVSQFETMFGITLEKRKMPSWSLRPHSSSPISGFAYTGQLYSLAGHSFNRSLMVLGFNHNIQSSFGVTKEVIAAIRRWIGSRSEDALG
jgi:hypothetical protein